MVAYTSGEAAGGPSKAVIFHVERRGGVHFPFVGPWAGNGRIPKSWARVQHIAVLAVTSQHKPVPTYTAWWHRHACARNLPRVVTLSRTRNRMIREQAYIIPCYMNSIVTVLFVESSSTSVSAVNSHHFQVCKRTKCKSYACIFVYTYRPMIYSRGDRCKSLIRIGTVMPLRIGTRLEEECFRWRHALTLADDTIFNLIRCRCPQGSLWRIPHLVCGGIIACCGIENISKINGSV